LVCRAALKLLAGDRGPKRRRSHHRSSDEEIEGVAQTIVDPESLSLTLLGNLKSPGFSTDMLREAVA